MDQNNSQQHLIRSYFLKNITKLLLSVSIFSLFFSHSSCLSLLLTHTLDKNCIFLLFNGLVVFLAKTSGLITSSSKHKALDHHYHHVEYSKPESMFVEIEEASSLVEKEVSHHGRNPNMLIVNMEEETESDHQLWTEEEEEEEDGTLSTEELNKKFDEFIRKMKEELRIEAQQQQPPIMV